ncbi:MAG: DUF1269 domain-containing protein [Chloroflexi bacterium]|nr:DUF1269 domain-containing protein [Chloroflexota bacterium]
MSQLVAVVYPSQATAAEVLTTLQSLQSRQLIRIADACIVTRDANGKVKLHQGASLIGAGALGGAMWGGLIGLIFLAPLLGMAIGAAAGAAGGAMSDYGVDDKFMRELGQQLEGAKAALFVMVAEATPDKVLAEVARFGGQVLHTNLSQEAEAQLQAALDAGGAAPAQ